MRGVALVELRSAWTGEGARPHTNKELIREAVELYLAGMSAHGDPVPAPSPMTEYITV